MLIINSFLYRTHVDRLVIERSRNQFFLVTSAPISQIFYYYNKLTEDKTIYGLLKMFLNAVYKSNRTPKEMLFWSLFGVLKIVFKSYLQYTEKSPTPI